MSKGISGLYEGTSGSKFDTPSSSPVNGKDYNPAGSSSVKKVDSVTKVDDLHKMPDRGKPNSVDQNYKDGELTTERYFDEKGEPYLDIDYTDHGNSKTHPNVPHEHDVKLDEDGNIDRGKDKKVKK
ncbi:MAG: hypothetical protein MJ146_02785 [Clostridia bacterium]|nr:hypothetical protein [Clostridia bacterium]